MLQGKEFRFLIIQGCSDGDIIIVNQKCFYSQGVKERPTSLTYQLYKLTYRGSAKKLVANITYKSDLRTHSNF